MQNQASSVVSLRGNPIDPAHARWIKQRIGALMSFYWTPNDEAIAKVQAHQFVRILSDYSREEINDAANVYAATVEDRAPNPAKLVKLIEAARKQIASKKAEQERRAQEKREHEERETRRKQYPTPERAAQIIKDAGFNLRMPGKRANG